MAEKNLSALTDMTPDQYMKDRIIYKIAVYGKLGKRHRWLYYITSFAAIVCAALVPVLIQNPDNSNAKWAAIILSLLVTVLVSAEKLFHFRQHWRNYDSIESHLRSEQVSYQTRTGFYGGKHEADAFNLLVSRIEEGIKHEREQTIEMRTKETAT